MTYQLITTTIRDPRRVLADCNRFSKRPRLLFASIVNMAGSRIGWPLPMDEILKFRTFPDGSKY